VHCGVLLLFMIFIDTRWAWDSGSFSLLDWWMGPNVRRIFSCVYSDPFSILCLIVDGYQNENGYRKIS
jgi:hypothetical protein